MASSDDLYAQAAAILRQGKRAAAFTGAGISVESGIPPFRGEGGLWTKYDPSVLDIRAFRQNPGAAWQLIKDIFYDFFGEAHPNAAHRGLAQLEKLGLIHTVITQNIDNLHQEAGSRVVHEFHGTAQAMVCLRCRSRYRADWVDLGQLPPSCEGCGGLLKPDFVFFGEAIPEPVQGLSFAEAQRSDVFLLIGTSGEVMPACMIPRIAKEQGARMIEINTEPSDYTAEVSDVFLQAPATVAMTRLLEALGIQPD